VPLTITFFNYSAFFAGSLAGYLAGYLVDVPSLISVGGVKPVATLGGDISLLFVALGWVLDFLIGCSGEDSSFLTFLAGSLVLSTELLACLPLVLVLGSG